MNVIKLPNENVINFLGGFMHKKDNVKYRWNKLCITLATDDEMILVYNDMTGELVSFHECEYNNIFTEDPCDYSEHMYATGFLVPEDFNEEEVITNYRKANSKYVGPTYLDNPGVFTILTTTKCNARCPYCYELGIKGKHDMTPETANKVGSYIIKNAKPGQEITIGWFGGEPLYNQQVIDTIIAKVRGAGISYKTNMISNGYLFNNKTVMKAKRLWGLTDVQITLDGIHDKYNKTKRYIYKDDPDPFHTVIGNIHKLLYEGIAVSIRMNVSKDNIDDIIELVEFIKTEFKQHNNLTAYVWDIFTDTPRTEEDAKILFEGMNKIDYMLSEAGLRAISTLGYGIKTTHCMVDDGNSVLISPSGEIGLCEHYPNENFMSHIDTPHIKNFEVIKDWKKFVINDGPACEDCVLKATCLKSPKCTDKFVCTFEERNYLIEKYKRDMLQYYNLPMNEHGCQCGNESCCKEN